MNNPGLAHILYRALEKLHYTDASDSEKTIEINRLLTKLFVELTNSENIKFSTMFARIAYVCHQNSVSKAQQWRIHRLRRQARQALHQSAQVSEQNYLSGLKTACFCVASLCQTAVPGSLAQLLPEKDEIPESAIPKVAQKIAHMRVVLVEILADKEFLN